MLPFILLVIMLTFYGGYFMHRVNGWSFWWASALSLFYIVVICTVMKLVAG